MSNIYTLVNEAQRPLLDEFFRPTLARVDSTANLTVFDAPSTDGDYKGRGYREVILEKVRLILDVLAGEDREPVVWSDVDVTFHGSSSVIEAAVSELGDADLAFQREVSWHQDVNTGFFVARRCADARRPFEQVHAALRRPRNGDDDQTLMNRLIADGLRVQRLSPRFLANSYRRDAGWKTLAYDTLVFHANWAFSVKQRQTLLRAYDSPHETSAAVASC